MSDQIDTLYEQNGLDQTALTNGVTLATAGPNETLTIRDIQINNPGRTLDFKIGNTTIITNTGSTSYGGTEYLGPGQSLVLQYRAGTYPPAAQTAPNVYCNKFELYSSQGRQTFYLNGSNIHANQVIPWSNSSTYNGYFTSHSIERYRGGNAANFGGSNGFLWRSVSDTDHYYCNASNYLYRRVGRLDGTLYPTPSENIVTVSVPGNSAANISSPAYDGSRYIYGLVSQVYPTDDNNWGYLARVDTLNNGATTYFTVAASDPESLIDKYFSASSTTVAAGINETGWQYGDAAMSGQILDGYYVVKPNQNYPTLLFNLSNNTVKVLPFGATSGYSSWQSGVTYFAKSAAGEYIVAQYTGCYGSNQTAAPYYYTMMWWNIGSNLANPTLVNSGIFRVRTDDDYNYPSNSLQPTRDPYNPSYYYVMNYGSYTADLSNTGSARNNHYFKIIDFTYGYPQFLDIRCARPVMSFGMRKDSTLNRVGIVIPSLTNYSWTAPATPAFGTVDVRVAGIRSSI